MDIIKWKLKIKKIENVKNIIIYSLNQNNLINLENEETFIYFYTLKNQKKILVQIDGNIFSLHLNEEKKNYEEKNIVKAILFYNKEGIIKYNFNKQNRIDDRYIYCRRYNTLVPEYRNKYFFLILRDIVNNSYFGSNTIAKILTYMVAYFMNSNVSSILVNKFIDHYKINPKKYIVKGPTFNDFFIRELKEPLTILKNNDYIFSPVSARTVFFNYKNYYKLNLYIKGKNFRLSKLIDEKKIQTKYSVVISRLAINDYHHLHMPEDGKLIEIKEFNGNYISVDKEYLQSELNVLTDNKRVVLKFKRDDGSKFFLVMVGSILISSIVYKLELNKKYYTKERIAYFQYGGSCVVYVSDRNIYFDDDILYFSNEGIESYIKVGDEIGNIHKQKKVNFIKNYHIKRHVIGFLNKLIEYIIKMIIRVNQKINKILDTD